MKKRTEGKKNKMDNFIFFDKRAKVVKLTEKDFYKGVSEAYSMISDLDVNDVFVSPNKDYFVILENKEGKKYLRKNFIVTDNVCPRYYIDLWYIGLINKPTIIIDPEEFKSVNGKWIKRRTDHEIIYLETNDDYDNTLLIFVIDPFKREKLYLWYPDVSFDDFALTDLIYLSENDILRSWCLY